MSGGATLSIGAIARDSGLTVSALRFYDAAGVLHPARVDAATGYRWYAAEQVSEARLIASLRTVGMPLTDICELLEVRHDTVAAGRLLDRYLLRLEQGFTDARRRVTAVRRLLEHEPMTEMSLRGADLVAAIHAVRFAVSADPALHALSGVLVEYDGETLRLVASDRYRLAIATVITRNRSGPPARLIAPLSLLDELVLTPDHDVRISFNGCTLSIGAATAKGIDAVFPDYQRLLRVGISRTATVGTNDLIERLTTGPARTMVQAPHDEAHDVCVVLVDGESIRILGEDHPDAAGFNRQFLLEALGTRAADHLVLAIDGPLSPLAILDPDRPGDISLLMPTRLSA